MTPLTTEMTETVEAIAVFAGMVATTSRDAVEQCLAGLERETGHYDAIGPVLDATNYLRTEDVFRARLEMVRGFVAFRRAVDDVIRLEGKTR